MNPAVPVAFPTSVIHYPFHPDEARSAAAELAHPDHHGNKVGNWQPHIRPQPPTPIEPAPHYTTSQIRTMIGRPGVDIDGWERHANCQGCASHLFFPERGDGYGIRQGKAVCAACPVTVECLTHALNNGERWGVWGGMSEAERRKLRRRLAVRAVAA